MAARPRKKKWGKDLRWPARMRRYCLAGKLNCRTFWTNTLSIYASEVRQSLILLCLPQHRPTAGGGTTILFRRFIFHHSETVLSLTHVQAPADRRVKILAAYVSPSHLLIGAKMSACFCRWMPVLLVGDLNAKHVDWKSLLSTRGETSYVIMLLEMAQKVCTLQGRKILGKFLNKKIGKQINISAVR